MAAPYISDVQYQAVHGLRDKYKDTGITMDDVLGELAGILDCEPGGHFGWCSLIRWIESASGQGRQLEFPERVEVRPRAPAKDQHSGTPAPYTAAEPSKIAGTKRNAQGNQVSKGKGKANQSASLVDDEVWVDEHHNRSMVLQDGHRLGASARYPLPEKGVRFIGEDWELKKNELYCRTVTNFRFVNRGGDDISVALGLGESPPFYLLGAVGTLDIRTESGQRLAAGWWQVPPSTARAEIIWLRVPVRQISVETPNWLPGSRVAVSVDGEEATYALQCPHPEFKRRWDACTPNMVGFRPFVGLSLGGARPPWFGALYWSDLTQEYSEWMGAQKAIDPPQPSFVSPAQIAVFEAEAVLASHRAALRNLTAEQTEIVLAIHNAQRSTLRSRSSRTQQKLNGEIAEWRKELSVVQNKIKNFNAKMEEAQGNLTHRMNSCELEVLAEGIDIAASGGGDPHLSAIDEQLNVASTVPSWEMNTLTLVVGRNPL